MTSDEALAQCEATVRRFDPDRYFASLFAPSDVRPLLFALYAFHHELARVNEIAREPMIAEIRLQWWRDAVDAARLGAPPAHPAALGLTEIFTRTSASHEPFDQLIDAYSPNRPPIVSADISASELFAEGTSATLMRVGAFLLGAETASGDMVRDAGIAYGLARILHDIPSQAARGKFVTSDSAAMKDTIARIATAARTRFSRIRKVRLSRHTLPAILPAALVSSYLARAARVGDPLHERIEISPLRRQLILLRAATLGQL